MFIAVAVMAGPMRSATKHLAAIVSRAKPNEVVSTAASRRTPFARRDIACGVSSIPISKTFFEAEEVATSAASKRTGGYEEVSSLIDGLRPVRDTRHVVYPCS